MAVTGKQYQKIIENFLCPKIGHRHDKWFQQDKATAYTARATIVFLCQRFNGKLISLTENGSQQVTKFVKFDSSYFFL